MKKFLTAIVFFAIGFIAGTAHATERTGMEILFTMEDKQAWCLAQNIYYETRGSNFADQVAVADVVLNRVKDTRYPNTVCEVVQQGRNHANGQPKRNQCQFSWWCDGKSDYPTNKDAWAHAQQTAYMMLYLDQYRGISEGATHYHAHYVNPRWAKSFHLVGTIGEHKFYRWVE
jgi:spore germination cell wall hydrolase CwlJ-like protein